MISTRDLSRLPDIEALRKLTQSLAMLDAILSPEWEYRYFSYNSRWTAGEELASMRDGEGDGWFCVLNAEGAFFKGFGHEISMSPWNARQRRPPKIWPGVLENVPAAFAPFLTEPAFAMEETTFCLWRERTDSAWRRGSIAFPDAPGPDGSAALLAMLDGDPAAYHAAAEENYDRPIALTAIARIYRHEPLSAALVREIDDEVEFGDLMQDADEIGYPR